MLAELLLSATLQVTQLVKNPTTIQFVCVDHDKDDQHELDVIRASDNTVIATLLLGDPPADANGLVTATLNVHPIAFGTYFGKVRAVAGTLKSDDSAPSNQFQRAPGQPTVLVIK
jgi:hypothetical protein